MRRQSVTAGLVGVSLFVWVSIVGAAPLTPAFTYQGKYEANGVPVTGSVHLRISLWDAVGSGQPPLGGAQIGPSQLLTDVPVADGVFTVVLNAGGEFGPTAFNGDARWLQIEVCADPGCSTLSILSPRQPITGAPYSINTLSAPWTGLTGVPEGFADGVDDIGDPVWEVNEEGGISYNVGGVGIGTGTSLLGARLQVNDGRIRIRESATLQRWDLFYDPPSQKFYLQENAAYNHLVFTKGPDHRVGIGTHDPNPNAKVHIYASSVNHAALWGESENAPYGILGIARRDGAAGVSGSASPNGTGVSGNGKTGVLGVTHVPGGVAVEGFVGFGVSALSGKFNGDVDVAGTVLKSGDSNRIDHPLDPTNKYLFHSSVESPDMMNIYNGNAITDGAGFAKIVLPEYFEAYNKDFRYQLTVLGDFAQAAISKEIKNNAFEIRTDKPNVKVSWQVTGIRNDPYAKANPLEVVTVKKPEEKGKYLSPELYGQPKEKGIRYRAELEAAAPEKVLKDK